MKQHVHIVAFDIPWPPNYGGVIDVYYKILNMHRMGVGVILHTFLYHREPQKELNDLCEKVYYYKRKTGIRSACSRFPYIVKSRRSEELAENLSRDPWPVIFEGLHSCYHLGDPRLASRRKLYRESNIEHDYYRHLAKAEKNLFRKAYYLLESRKLERFESILEHATDILAVSESDTRYLTSHFPDKRSIWLPSFHKDDEITSLPGNGNYVLYQGNLSVPENEAAAVHIITKIYREDMPELVIAGMNPSGRLRSLAASMPNIRLVVNPSEAEMEQLIREAHVNLMVTFQPTGLKLKLLNALFNGRFVLVNPHMLAGTGLDPLCAVAGSPEEFRVEIRELFLKTFTREDVESRKQKMPVIYSNRENASILLKIIEGAG